MGLVNYKGSTLSTYLAAISSVLTMNLGVKLTKVPELIALLISFKLEGHQKKYKVQAWDCNIVLQHLTSDDYKPLQQVDFELLTQKMLFLLALATAARMSEIHAKDYSRTKFDTGDHPAVHLGLRWDFIAKNQLPGQPDRQFYIPALSSILGPDDTQDLPLCPVRVVKIYLQRTAGRRRRFKRLFIPLSPAKYIAVSRTTISFWFRAIILRAYKAAVLDQPRASNHHEVRAIASTLAIHGNCSVTSIMEGCFWKSDSVFANHYLRDIATEDVAGIYLFGPLVVAQQLAVPTRRK